MKNEIEIKNNLVYIKIINRKKEIFYSIIDKKNLDKVLKFNKDWNASLQKTGIYYACCNIEKFSKNGKKVKRSYFLHQLIMGISLYDTEKYKIDHINHNGLDNTEENLRFADKSRNATHRKDINSNNTSGHRNVSWIQGYWRVQLQINAKNHIFKEKFTDVDLAGIFAEQMRLKYYGEYAGK